MKSTANFREICNWSKDEIIDLNRNIYIFYNENEFDEIVKYN